MKNFKSLMIAALAFMASITLASCSDDDDSPIGSKEDLIGRWESVHETGWEKEDGEIVDEWDETGKSLRWEFYKNGICTAQEWTGSRWESADYGTYTYKNGTITIKSDEYDEDDVIKVKKLTATELVVEESYSYWDEGDKYEGYICVTFEKVADFDED